LKVKLKEKGYRQQQQKEEISLFSVMGSKRI